MSLFSLIIPTFNRAGLIGRTLESVFAQELLPSEIIVVDDGSTDGTLELLASYGSKIRVLTQANRGPGAARNLGVRHATGDYVVFLDSDDLWFPWTLATYARAIKAHRWPGLVSGKLLYFHEEAEATQHSPGPLHVEAFADYFESSKRGIYCGAGQMVIRRDVFLQVGGFVEERINGEDHDLMMRLGTQRGFVWIESPCMVAYRQHAEAITLDFAKTCAGMEYLIRQEREGLFPGGLERAGERRRILTQHLRPISLKLARHGQGKVAWKLYRQSFGWNLRQGRLKYLVGMLGVLGLGLFGRRARHG